MARCRHTGTRGNCPQAAIEGSVYCAKHSNEADRLKGYRVNNPKLQARLSELDREASLATLRQEVLLLRVLIEEKINFAQTDAELIAVIPTITSAFTTIDKLVNSLDKMQRATSFTLEKPALGRLGEKIVEILIKNLGDLPDRDEIVDRVAAEIAQAIVEIKNEG